jgi:hypothetical protein
MRWVGRGAAPCDALDMTKMLMASDNGDCDAIRSLAAKGVPLGEQCAHFQLGTGEPMQRVGRGCAFTEGARQLPVANVYPIAAAALAGWGCTSCIQCMSTRVTQCLRVHISVYACTSS